MESDIDLDRALLTKIANNPEMDGTRDHPYFGEVHEALRVPGYPDEKIIHQLKLLEQRGCFIGKPRPYVSGLSPAGHDYLNSIRSRGK